MSKYWKALKRGIKATTSEFQPGQFELAGKPVKCPHCGHNEFARSSAQLNSRGLTFVGLDWADKSASTLACTNCGRVEWFLKRPERL